MKQDIYVQDRAKDNFFGDFKRPLTWPIEKEADHKKDVSLTSHDNAVPFAEIEKQIFDSMAINKKNQNSEVNAYFKKTPRLNSYSVIEIDEKIAGKNLKFVVEQDEKWLQDSLNKFFKKNVERLSLEEVLSFLKYKASRLNAKNLNDHLGIVSKNEAELTEDKIHFLDGITLKSKKKYSLPIVTQLVLEKYTDLQSRIVAVETEGQLKVLVLFKEVTTFESYIVLDPSLKPSNIHLQRVSELSDAKFKLLRNGIVVTHPRMVWSEKAKAITIISQKGQELHFQVSGRTPTEKRFRKEEELIQAAQDTDLVPIEIYFLPYYRPLGHTAIRIGESLFELSMKGWKLHGDGNDSARAFLFNNPFFKTQYNLLNKFGMKPASVGKTIKLEKSKAIHLRNLMKEFVTIKESKENKFNILSNNCNQGIMRALSSAGVEGFAPNGYIAFSSVLSFRKYLLESPYETESLYIYPLPNTPFTDSSLRKFIPGLIYRDNDIASEFKRTFPRYFHNILYANYHFVKKKIKNFIVKEKNEEPKV